MQTNHSKTLLNLLGRLWRQLKRRRRVEFLLLAGLMFASALAEIVSLGAVVPFLGVLVAPDDVYNNSLILEVSQRFGINTAEQLVFPLTVMFVLVAVIAGIVRVALLWSSTKLAFSTGADLGIEIYRRTLYQPYRVHASRNSSEVVSSITNKTDSVVFSVLVPLLTLISSSVLAISVVAALIVIDPMIAWATGGAFGVSYLLVSIVSRRNLKRSSLDIALEQTRVHKALQEGLGGIRDVLLDGTQELYCDIFHRADRNLRRAQGSVVFVGGSPRFAMEALGMILIAILAYVLLGDGGGFAKYLPVLGVLALGAQRLLPALQQIYFAWSSVVGYQHSLSDVLDLLDQPFFEARAPVQVPPLSFDKAICLQGVRFRYSSETPWVLNGVDLTIQKGSRVGIVGATGSGKSTLLDLLMGLLTPTEGELRVDGRLISDDLVKAWQHNIAHVPQSIYLSDSTVAENIAFGKPIEFIDLDRVRSSASQAQASYFIEKSSKGYQTFVGERGIRLSGGQRQRIGIARALYKTANLLVFDEATSALDNVTEQAVIDAISELNDDLTILLIAHRLTTVQHCDVIIELEDGRVKARGTYEELLNVSPTFRALARA